MRHVVLVGPMGSGKTTIGRRVADALGRRFVDNDVSLERRTGRTAMQIAAADGVAVLHREEAAELLAALDDPVDAVIAAAASVVLDETVRARLAAVAWVVWLRAGPATLAARLPSSPDRPHLDADAAVLVARQARERDALYRAMADVVISTDEQTPEMALATILGSLPASLRAHTET